MAEVERETIEAGLVTLGERIMAMLKETPLLHFSARASDPLRLSSMLINGLTWEAAFDDEFGSIIIPQGYELVMTKDGELISVCRRKRVDCEA